MRAKPGLSHPLRSDEAVRRSVSDDECDKAGRRSVRPVRRLPREVAFRAQRGRATHRCRHAAQRSFALHAGRYTKGMRCKLESEAVPSDP